MTGRLKKEIKQRRPFSSLQEEAVLALMRTADLVAVPLADVLRDAKLSPSQYNVLRILRGAEAPLACGEIADRMVRRDPDLTRLLDRLEQRGFVRRERGTTDRRVVLATITEEGLDLLDALDAPMEGRIRRELEHVPATRLKTLLDILDEIRAEVQ